MKLSTSNTVLKSWTILVLLVILHAVLAHSSNDVSAQSRFTNQPRIRREWRTLTPEMRAKVARAIWIMKNLTTAEGRAIYGDKFWNHDDLTMLHACSTNDPRCDQGHYGPQFMNFHRAYLLRFENSMLAVDPSTLALPYWDYSRDTTTGDCYNTDCYIFSDKFFGNRYGDPNQNYAVTNGLFAYWPITEWTSQRFGSTSPYTKYDCARLEYFIGTTASVCERCCGKSSCSCDMPQDVYKKWLRNHDDCTPYMARNPDEVVAIDGTRDLLGTQANFDDCTDPLYINNYMDWQNCIEFEQLSCIPYIGGVNCKAFFDSLPPLPFPFEVVSAGDVVCENCTLKSFYYDTNNVKQHIQPLHSQTHIRLGRDIKDVTTSPTDVGVFTGYHANVDRSHMTWMMKSYELYKETYWGYPDNQNDWEIRNENRLSGPWATYDALICSQDTDMFYEYSLFGSAWLNGTLLHETCNEGFPFDDLWESKPANGLGYTHQEIIYWSDPSRTIYTYDTLAGNYDYTGGGGGTGKNPGKNTGKTIGKKCTKKKCD